MPRARFRVPDDMEAGVIRSGFGAFVSGQEFDWPDHPKEGDNPSLKLIPANAEATALLKRVCELKIADAHPQAADAKALLEKIQQCETKQPYHEYLLGIEAKAKEVVPPEDRTKPDTDPSVPPEDRGWKRAKRTSDSK